MELPRKHKVVVDTNIFISGLIVPSSIPGQVISAWKNNLFTLLISKEIVSEIREVLTRPKIRNDYKIGLEDIDELLSNLELASEIVDSAPLDSSAIQARDPKDNIILTCALGGSADFIVSGDKDLLVLNKPL